MINADFIKFTKNGGDNKMKYRKKPIEVEAFQFNGNLKDSNDVYYVPNWAKQAFENGTLYFGHTKYNKPPYGLFIKTLDKVTHVSVGDFVIRDSAKEQRLRTIAFRNRIKISASTHRLQTAGIPYPRYTE